jgi:pimeloyl-ACP methyl ester carboxylesterase
MNIQLIGKFWLRIIAWIFSKLLPFLSLTLLHIGLTAMAHTQATDFLDIDDTKLYYQSQGTGQPLVLLHDGLLSSTVWDQQAAMLAKDFRVIRYDRRGFGQSPASSVEHSDHEDLHRLLQHLNITRANLIGSSAGGGVAIDFALSYPTQVRKLIVLGTTVSGYSYSDEHVQRNIGNNQPYIQNRDIKTTAAKWANDPFLIPSLHDTERLAQLQVYLEQEMAHFPRIAQTNQAKVALIPGAINRLQDLQTETLILIGERDHPDLVNLSSIAGEELPKVKYILVAQVGHFIHLENPALFHKFAVEFLSN